MVDISNNQKLKKKIVLSNLEKIMTSTTITNVFALTHLNQACLVQMPSNFTSVEANSFKQLLQKFCRKDAVVLVRNFLRFRQNKSAVKKIILDFEKTTFMDSNGLVGLCQIVQFAKNNKFDLTFRCFSPQVKMILSLAGLEKVISTESSQDNIILEQSSQKTDLHPAVVSQSKRLLDIGGSLVGLMITAVLFVPIAIAIKLNSPGPILFSQIRCGYKGKQFRIWKFRSMVVNAEQLQDQVDNQADGPFFKNTNDSRVTKVGKFLRKTSLDEFPQFWNILKGDMSLVGTRPPTVEEVEGYTMDDWQRLNVKAGLTGEWQVSGRSEITDFKEVLRLDLQYQKKWSVFYDLQLIFQTISVVFSKRSGAC